MQIDKESEVLERLNESVIDELTNPTYRPSVILAIILIMGMVRQSKHYNPAHPLLLPFIEWRNKITREQVEEMWRLVLECTLYGDIHEEMLECLPAGMLWLLEGNNIQWR